MSKTKKDDMPETTPDPVAFVEEPVSTPAIPPPALPTDGKQTIEQWQIVCGTPQWLWAGMKLGMGWPIGKEVTREEYDAAVKWAASVPCQ